MTRTTKRVIGAGALVLFALTAAVVIPNLRSLYEGVCRYLRDACTYADAPEVPVSPTGRYAPIVELVRLPNERREEFVHHALAAAGLAVTRIPIPKSTDTDLFVQFDTGAPRIVFCAHYDIVAGIPHFEGASDNAAAVCVLLAAAKEFARRGDGGVRAFLFTGQEETGLAGARAFAQYARAQGIAIREIINFDGLGRGSLALRPSCAASGFVFTLPLAGDFMFDGSECFRSPSFCPSDSRLVRAILAAQPATAVYERFTATTDALLFEQAGFATVAISCSDMFFLERTWHRSADRVALLDERNLDLAYDLVMHYAEGSVPK